MSLKKQVNGLTGAEAVIALILVLALNALILAGGVWVVVEVLKWTNVIH